MFEWNGWFGFTVSVLILGGGAFWIRHDNLKKSAEIRAQVSERGWRYRFYQEPGLWARLSRIASVVALRDRLSQAEHMIEGAHRGWQFKAYQQLYRTSGSGGHDGDTRDQCVRVRLSAPTGDMTLAEPAPDSLASTLANRVGFGGWLPMKQKSEVDLGDPVFAERFQVRADDADRARAVFTAGVRSWILDDYRAASWPVTFRGDWASSTEEMPLNVEDVAARLDYLVDLLERIGATSVRPS